MAGRFLVAQFLLVYLRAKNYVGLFLFSDGNNYPELTYVPLGSNKNLFVNGFLPGTIEDNYYGVEINVSTWEKKRGVILTRYEVFKDNIIYPDFSASVFELNGKNVTITPSQKIPLSTDVSGIILNYNHSGLFKVADGKFFYILGLPFWTENSSVSLFSAIVSVSSNNIVTFESVTAIDETSTIAKVYSQNPPPAPQLISIPVYENYACAWYNLRTTQPNRSTVVITFVRLIYGYFTNTFQSHPQLAEIHFYAMSVNLSGSSVSSSSPTLIRPIQTNLGLSASYLNRSHQVTAVSESLVVTCYIVNERMSGTWFDRQHRFFSLLTTSVGGVSVSPEIEIDPFYTYTNLSVDEYKTWLLGSENYLIFVYTGCLETDIEDFDPTTNYTARMLISLIKKTGSSFELLETIDAPYNKLYNKFTKINNCHFIKLSQDTFCGMNYSRLSNNPNTGKPIEPYYYILRVEDDSLVCSETFPIKDFDLLEQFIPFDEKDKEITRI